jgi:hypothetical protein
MNFSNHRKVEMKGEKRNQRPKIKRKDEKRKIQNVPPDDKNRRGEKRPQLDQSDGTQSSPEPGDRKRQSRRILSHHNCPKDPSSP